METLNVGITIMTIGMSVVFLFLIIMIFAMNISSKAINLLNKYFPEEIPEEPKKKNQKTDNDSEIALAIACAIKERTKAL